MLSFFRINDPYRIIGVIVILFLIRLPFLMNPEYIITPEIKWMLLGEKLAEGNLLYKEVWDTTAPFSALTYSIIHIIFGKSILTYRILSFILTIFYAFYFSRVLINNTIYLEKTYVPAVTFVIFSSIFYDFFTLSPPLLGLMFMLICFNYLFKLLDKGIQDNQYYNIGFLIGLAALFYLPYATYLILLIIGMFFYSNTSLRKYLLTFLGFCFPFLSVFIFYSLYYGLDSLFYMYLVSFLTTSRVMYVGVETLIILIVIPSVFVVLAMGKLLVAPRFVNYQQKTQQLMIFYLLVSAVSYLLIMEVSPMHWIMAVPALSFFGAHYLLLIRKKIFSEISFVLLIITTPLFTLALYYKLINIDFLNYEESLIPITYEAEFTNKKILVLGEDLKPYQHNSLATPYLNWSLAENHFKQLKYYEVVLSVYKNLNKNLPEVIIDKTNSSRSLFDRIPTISSKYEKCGINQYCLKTK